MNVKRLIDHKYISARPNALVLIGLCLSVYFLYNLVAGERSYSRYLTLNYKIARAEKDLDSTKAERETLEKKVVMMRPGSVNRDLLEEQARSVLGFRYPGEKVLINDAK